MTPTSGFLLLPPSPIPGYRGVDRNKVGLLSPFEPRLIEGEMDLSFVPKKGDNAIWAYFPPGWRRDAYRLYEEDMVDDGKWDPILLSSREVAHRIREIIEPHLGPHEIVACEIGGLDTMLSDEVRDKTTFLGFDVAYPPGGDYYSAIRNGLFTNPDPELVLQYQQLLNQFGLFSNTKPILVYVSRFKELVLSETDSIFCIYKLGIA
jgi:hypothetical protein